MTYNKLVISKQRRVIDSENHQQNTTTVKSAHAVTSIKQSPVLKGHLFFVLS